MLAPCLNVPGAIGIEEKAPAALSCPGISRILAKNPAPSSAAGFSFSYAHAFSSIIAASALKPEEPSMTCRHIAIPPMIVILALLLGGCFISERDLISPRSADYPITDGMRFTVHALDEQGKRTGEAPKTALITREGARYLLAAGENDTILSGLMTEIGPGLYAVMAHEAGAASGNFYVLMRRDGTTWWRWSMVCPDFVSRAGEQGKALADFGVEVRNSDCVVEDFASLTRALLFAHEHQKPDAEYVAE